MPAHPIYRSPASALQEAQAAECPSSYCAADVTSTTTAKSDTKDKPKTGAIAGGVVGGVVVIAVLAYLVWRFCVKPKRQQYATKEHVEANADQVNGDGSFNTRRAQRSSTHTVHSIASTVLTRASNIIQIAYIPGVMNRASPSSPAVLVPPVPPIPIAISGASQTNGPAGHEQHFFVPGDLRDSTYSGFSGFSDRTSFARTSYAPRSSIASTIYGKNAVIVAPPQTGMRAKPTVVNLKSPNGLAPPVPHVDYEKYNSSNSSLRPSSAANSTFSVGSTFLSNASAAQPVRPVVVRVGTTQKRSLLSQNTSAFTDSSSVSDIDSVLISPVGEKAPSSAAGVSRESTAITLIEDSPTPDQGPFSDPPAHSADQRESGFISIAEESTMQASPKDAPRSTERRESPFSDEHATHDS
ncbi:opy2-like protein [Grosmannia clavigera kw1407]|uniref:Opy2-like protein n=1 Tax=Grosmannia clavigera (strain kw1407 / UAMH 11150) TaxID=655863 RepID=F0XFC0_GROCL|nr:opy2-like protein [Grosmannia clavigera kw1407]EFX04780.1 opy2-like protein [Grosmannia clavigera kw1407]